MMIVLLLRRLGAAVVTDAFEQIAVILGMTSRERLELAARDERLKSIGARRVEQPIVDECRRRYLR